MTTFKSFSQFLFEGNNFGITFNPNASKYNSPQLKTKASRAPAYKDTYDSKDLKRYGIATSDYKGWERSVSQGLKVIKAFVDSEDFSKYKTAKDYNTNWEDKAYIYYTLTGWLGGYSQNKLSLVHIAYIGIVGKVDPSDFEVYNENWAGKFTGGSTENWPENRPQLILKPKFNLNVYTQNIINKFPTLENFPRIN